VGKQYRLLVFLHYHNNGGEAYWRSDAEAPGEKTDDIKQIG